jgi:hypothetical protein
MRALALSLYVGLTIISFSAINRFTVMSVDAYDGGKNNLLSCHRIADQFVQCQDERTLFLGGKLQSYFKLRQVKIDTYREACGLTIFIGDGPDQLPRSSCKYWMLTLIADEGEPLQIHDFGEDRDRAELQKAHLEALLNHSTDPVGVQLWYGNSWYKEMFKSFLPVIVGISVAVTSLIFLIVAMAIYERRARLIERN